MVAPKSDHDNSSAYEFAAALGNVVAVTVLRHRVAGKKREGVQPAALLQF